MYVHDIEIALGRRGLDIAAKCLRLLLLQLRPLNLQLLLLWLQKRLLVIGGLSGQVRLLLLRVHGKTGSIQGPRQIIPFEVRPLMLLKLLLLISLRTPLLLVLLVRGLNLLLLLLWLLVLLLWLLLLRLLLLWVLLL